MVGVPIGSLGKPGDTELAPAALREQGILEILGAMATRRSSAPGRPCR